MQEADRVRDAGDPDGHRQAGGQQQEAASDRRGSDLPRQSHGPGSH